MSSDHYTDAEYGFHGTSHFQRFCNLDMIDGLCIDIMHTLHLGVVKKVIELVFDTTNEIFSLKKHIKDINKYACDIYPPSCIDYSSSDLSMRNNWKAKDFKFFITTYGPIILDDFLLSITENTNFTKVI